MGTPTIFLIDDHASVRHAVGEMLQVFGFAVETFESADAFLAKVDPQAAGCVVSDVRLPGTDGIELVRQIASRNLSIPVVLISGHADVPMAVAGIKAGAEDFLEKPLDDAKLVAAINRALGKLFDRQDRVRSREALDKRFGRLTPRQVEIFDLVVQGLTSNAIAGKLNLGVRTVESYRAEIMEKMEAVSVAVLVRQAIRLGRITP
jgi:two-component system response regulator FixJ